MDNDATVKYRNRNAQILLQAIIVIMVIANLISLLKNEYVPVFNIVMIVKLFIHLGKLIFFVIESIYKTSSLSNIGNIISRESARFIFDTRGKEIVGIVEILLTGLVLFIFSYIPLQNIKNHFSGAVFFIMIILVANFLLNLVKDKKDEYLDFFWNILFLLISSGITLVIICIVSVAAFLISCAKGIKNFIFTNRFPVGLLILLGLIGLIVYFFYIFITSGKNIPPQNIWSYSAYLTALITTFFLLASFIKEYPKNKQSLFSLLFNTVTIKGKKIVRILLFIPMFILLFFSSSLFIQISKIKSNRPAIAFSSLYFISLVISLLFVLFNFIFSLNTNFDDLKLLTKVLGSLLFVITIILIIALFVGQNWWYIATPLIFSVIAFCIGLVYMFKTDDDDPAFILGDIRKIIITLITTFLFVYLPIRYGLLKKVPYNNELLMYIIVIFAILSWIITKNKNRQ